MKKAEQTQNLEGDELVGEFRRRLEARAAARFKKNPDTSLQRMLEVCDAVKKEMGIPKTKWPAVRGVIMRELMRKDGN